MLEKNGTKTLHSVREVSNRSAPHSKLSLEPIQQVTQCSASFARKKTSVGTAKIVSECLFALQLDHRLRFAESIFGSTNRNLFPHRHRRKSFAEKVAPVTLRARGRVVTGSDCR